MPKDLKESLTKILKAVAIIYAVLLALFFAVSAVVDKLPKPYHKRTISAEVTPWLK